MSLVLHADWYLASLEAGRPLTTRAEIVYFAGKAKQHVQKLEPELLRLQQPLRWCERLTAGRGAQHRRRRKHRQPEALVQLALQGAALALLLHLLILSRRTLGSKAV